MIRARPLVLLALAAAVGLTACAPIDLPAPPVGSPGDEASAGASPLDRQSEVEKRQRRLARKRDKACEKHPERCDPQ